MSTAIRFAVLGLALVVVQGPVAVWAYDLQIGQNYTSTVLWRDYDTRPPDTTGAAGPGAVVELTNGSYRCYDKASGTLLDSKTLDGFWASAGVNPAGDGAFSPRVLYDHASGRWFAAAADDPAGYGGILLAVSNSSDPLDGWQAFRITPSAQDDYSLDSTTLGVNADGVFVCANATAASDGSVANLVLSVPKADLANLVPSVSNASLLFPEDPGVLGWAVQPAVDFGSSVGREALLAVNYNSFGVLNHTSILGADTGTAFLSGTSEISVPATSYPLPALQPGGAFPLDTGDDRLASSVYKVGTSLWAVHTIDVGGRAGLQWYEIDEPTSTLLQSGTISDADHDYFSPSICANDAGIVVIAFNRSAGERPLRTPPLYGPEMDGPLGSDEYVSVYAVLGETSAGTTTFGVPLSLVTGSGSYEVAAGSEEINAWGRHSALVRDPDDPFTFWAFTQYASDVDEYSTRITELRATEGGAVPEPGSCGLLAAGLVGVILWRRRKA